MSIKKILSDERIEQIIKETNATMAMEGFEPDEISSRAFRKYAKGEITEKEALKELKDSITTGGKNVVYKTVEEVLGEPSMKMD